MCLNWIALKVYVVVGSISMSNFNELVCPPLVFFLWPAGQESNQPTSFPHQQLSWQHSHHGIGEPATL